MQYFIWIINNGFTRQALEGALHVCVWGDLPEGPAFCLQAPLSCPAAEAMSSRYPHDHLKIWPER